MGDIWSTKWMSLGWLRYLVFVSFIRTSLQYGDEGPDGNYSAIANYSAFMKPSPNNCACHDRDGRIYNLAPLQNTDGTASLTAKSKKYPGYSYAYNPCTSFKLGPKDGGCQKDVAICWYVPKGSPDTFKTIGNQGRAMCRLDKESKIPILVYHSREFRYRKATVIHKCDKRRIQKDEAIFEIIDEDEWKFQLTHLCACGDGCPINPVKPATSESDVTATPDSSDPMRVGAPVAASAGTAVFVLVVLLVVWLARRRHNNNDINENQRLLGNNAVDQVHNQIQEIPAGPSQPLPISPSPGKADVNVSSASV
ncbi:uncharacterized protein LOC144656029 isoform X2 [Oculina patagonica]